MPILPKQDKLFYDRQDLCQFLFALKQTVLPRDCDSTSALAGLRLLSLALEIPPVDPLAVLATFARPNCLHFYLEKAGENEAIAAIDAVASLEINGRSSANALALSRFDRSRQFIESCLARNLNFSHSNLPFAGAHFFCSFTFGELSSRSNSPFPSATIFLPRWQVSRKDNQSTLVVNLEIDRQTNIPAIAQEICTFVEQILAIPNHILTLGNSGKKKHPIPMNGSKFKSAVADSLKLIANQQFSKVVLAHAIDVISPQPFQPFVSLHNLRKAYNNCYIFSTSNGHGKTFIGASPERLISIQNREAIADALAGSAPRGKTPAEDEELGNSLLDNDKEQREHLVVIDFIAQQFVQLGLNPQIPLTPQLRQLANIQHLWTPIQAQVPTAIHPLDLVAALHPTPAVAGLPRDEAWRQIRRCEPFERSLYAAPLGWIDEQGNCEFVVGIRSALIDGDRARLFAGAGIIAGSQPDKELAEIQLKLQAMLAALV
jgi:menaquinone-specific isochorismate synthase